MCSNLTYKFCRDLWLTGILWAPLCFRSRPEHIMQTSTRITTSSSRNLCTALTQVAERRGCSQQNVRTSIHTQQQQQFHIPAYIVCGRVGGDAKSPQSAATRVLVRARRQLQLVWYRRAGDAKTQLGRASGTHAFICAASTPPVWPRANLISLKITPPPGGPTGDQSRRRPVMAHDAARRFI